MTAISFETLVTYFFDSKGLFAIFVVQEYHHCAGRRFQTDEGVIHVPNTILSTEARWPLDLAYSLEFLNNCNEL